MCLLLDRGRILHFANAAAVAGAAAAAAASSQLPFRQALNTFYAIDGT